MAPPTTRWWTPRSWTTTSRRRADDGRGPAGHGARATARSAPGAHGRPATGEGRVRQLPQAGAPGPDGRTADRGGQRPAHPAARAGRRGPRPRARAADAGSEGHHRDPVHPARRPGPGGLRRGGRPLRPGLPRGPRPPCPRGRHPADLHQDPPPRLPRRPPPAAPGHGGGHRTAPGLRPPGPCPRPREKMTTARRAPRAILNSGLRAER
ncbi:hypothetical protein SGPA1_20735 [Streptomyces misionensis JCM 4497]